MPLGRAQTRVDVPCVEFRAFRAHTHVYESVRDTSTISTMWRVVGLRGWSDKEKVGQSGACKVRARVSRQQKEKKMRTQKIPFPVKNTNRAKTMKTPRAKKMRVQPSQTQRCVCLCATLSGLPASPITSRITNNPKERKKNATQSTLQQKQEVNSRLGSHLALCAGLQLNPSR